MPVSGYRKAIIERVGLDWIWRLFVSAFVLLALIFSYTAGGKANSAIDRIEEGRRNGTLVTCGIATAVVNSGRNVIEHSSTLTPGLEVFLEAHGLPPRQQRQAGQMAAGHDYVQHITEGIEEAVGLDESASVVKPDGSINCARLRELARIR